MLAVRDTGLGIAPEVLQRMLEALARPDGGLDIRQGGLGLGLALARGIVGLHGGSVRARSGGTGHGAEFTVRLPLAKPAAPAPADEPADSADAAAHLRVLVVEDNPDTAESLRRLLRLHGHEVSVAVNGFDGVAEAKRCHPDAVVCDIGLPGMDGYAVALALRGDPDTARARLIAVTGYGRAEDRALRPVLRLRRAHRQARRPRGAPEQARGRGRPVGPFRSMAVPPCHGAGISCRSASARGVR